MNVNNVKQDNKCKSIQLAKPPKNQGIILQRWYSIRIELFGPEIKIYLDNVLIYHIDDNNSLSGSMSLGTGTGVTVFFDDIQVTELTPR